MTGEPDSSLFDASHALDRLIGDGYALMELPPGAALPLARIHDAAAEFFGMPNEAKLAHGSVDFNFGFRPFGRQYSETPDRPDLNESFTYWADDPTTVPNHERIGAFLGPLHDYWAVVTAVTTAIVDALGTRLSVDASPAFHPRSSYIEVNSYLVGETRPLLQDRHEDGHVLTVVASNAPGLEVERGGAMVPVDLGGSEVVIMAGSLLAALTDGLIAPMYHQVRNHRCPHRQTVLFLVNPRLFRSVAPFVLRASNRHVDVAAQARTNRDMFGLPESPILP